MVDPASKRIAYTNKLSRRCCWSFSERGCGAAVPSAAAAPVVSFGCSAGVVVLLRSSVLHLPPVFLCSSLICQIVPLCRLVRAIACSGCVDVMANGALVVASIVLLSASGIAERVQRQKVGGVHSGSPLWVSLSSHSSRCERILHKLGASEAVGFWRKSGQQEACFPFNSICFLRWKAWLPQKRKRKSAVHGQLPQASSKLATIYPKIVGCTKHLHTIEFPALHLNASSWNNFIWSLACLNRIQYLWPFSFCNRGVLWCALSSSDYRYQIHKPKRITSSFVLVRVCDVKPWQQLHQSIFKELNL